MTSTLLLRGGRVVDGSGGRERRADVLIEGGVVKSLLPSHRRPAVRQVLDVDGLVIAPGFIDIHSHSDLALLAQPGAGEKLRQGITTEVVGNCGMSVAPLGAHTKGVVQEYVRGVLGFEDVEWKWKGVAGYFEWIRRAAPAVNVATYIGLGTVRAAVCGFDADSPRVSARAEMAALIREGMSDGAVGVSSGLVYAPGSYSSKSEIWELVAAAAARGGVYSSHMRDQGDGFLESIKETLEVARRTGVSVLIAHHKVVGEENWGQTVDSLQLLEEARAAGFEVGSDVYPYLAGSTTMTALLPDWALAGGKEAMLSRLTDSSQRERIRQEWHSRRSGWDNRVSSLGLGNILIGSVSSDSNAELVGMSIVEAANRRGYQRAPDDFLLDLLFDERGELTNLQIACSEDDLRRVLSHPTTSFGTDGVFVGQRPHPRLRGAFPRILGTYVREEGVLTLEDAIHRMTALTAQRLSLARVGLIEPGYRADITVFDPDTVAGPATYEHPHLPPEGIEYVIVGGEIALEHGNPTGLRNGVVLTPGFREESAVIR